MENRENMAQKWFSDHFSCLGELMFSPFSRQDKHSCFGHFSIEIAFSWVCKLTTQEAKACRCMCEMQNIAVIAVHKARKGVFVRECMQIGGVLHTNGRCMRYTSVMYADFPQHSNQREAYCGKLDKIQVRGVFHTLLK